MPRIWMVSSECSPWAKSGGLGDAVAALSGELARTGDEVRVFVPGYASVRREDFSHHDGYISVPLGSHDEPAELRSLKTPDGLIVTIVEAPAFFGRPGFYGEQGQDYPDNDRRFAFFARAVAELAVRGRPDILHVHDWQAALVSFFARHVIPWPDRRPGILLTIHNVGYQGSFPMSALGLLSIPWNEIESHLNGGPLEFYGTFNFLKAGIQSADLVNTVSPAHASETLAPDLGFGLDGLLRHLGDRYRGILNGIDQRAWNPETGRFLAHHFSVDDLAGKGRLKQEVFDRFGLLGGERPPLIALVSRLVWQKGIDVALEALGPAIQQGARLVALGSGDPELEEGLRILERTFPGSVAVRIGFDENLSHLLIAASDMVLIPSRYEPCGLIQMQAMRYGALPVACRTGGLADTITDLADYPETGTGFLFSGPTAGALGHVLDKALALYRTDPAAWTTAMRRAMRKDFSWGRSAAEYRGLYRRALEMR